MFIDSLKERGYWTEGVEIDEIRNDYEIDDIKIVGCFYHGMGHYQVVGRRSYDPACYYFLALIGGSDYHAVEYNMREYIKGYQSKLEDEILSLIDRSIDSSPLTSNDD